MQNCRAGQGSPAAVMVVTNLAKMTSKLLYFQARVPGPDSPQIYTDCNTVRQGMPMCLGIPELSTAVPATSTSTQLSPAHVP